MIAQLRGHIVSENFTEAVMDVNGVGYRVFIPMSTYDKLPHSPEKEVTLLIRMQVKEDAITLYGFATAAERDAYELLITVNGIGPKSAISILSSMNLESLCAAIVSGDIKALKKISGVGPKSAERMIVELRDKMDKIVPSAAFTNPETGDSCKEAEDALLALEQLGFQGAKVKKTVADVAAALPKEQRSTENIIRKVLQSVNK